MAIWKLHHHNRSSLYSYPAFQGGFNAALQTICTVPVDRGSVAAALLCTLGVSFRIQWGTQRQLHKAAVRLQLGWKTGGHAVLWPLGAFTTHEALGRHSLHQDNTILKKKIFVEICCHQHSFAWSTKCFVSHPLHYNSKAFMPLKT